MKGYSVFITIIVLKAYGIVSKSRSNYIYVIGVISGC